MGNLLSLLCLLRPGLTVQYEHNPSQKQEIQSPGMPILALLVNSRQAPLSLYSSCR